MQLWTTWLESLRYLLELLSSDLGLGPGLAILALTLALRCTLLPVSWRSAYGACIRQQRLKRLQPELKRLQDRFRSDPALLAQETMQLYRKNGLRIMETGPILGALVQTPVLLGLFGVLRNGWQQARFLWIENLARPDFYLAVITAATTALMMLANPDLPEQTRILLVSVPAVLALVFALKFASALALYWVASNCFTAGQTYAVHYFVHRRIRSGAIKV